MHICNLPKSMVSDAYIDTTVPTEKQNIIKPLSVPDMYLQKLIA